MSYLVEDLTERQPTRHVAIIERSMRVADAVAVAERLAATLAYLSPRIGVVLDQGMVPVKIADDEWGTTRRELPSGTVYIVADYAHGVRPVTRRYFSLFSTWTDPEWQPYSEGEWVEQQLDEAIQKVCREAEIPFKADRRV